MVENVDQEDWNGVYYDASVGEFFMMDVGDEGVTLINPFVGNKVETLGFDEFNDLAYEGDFTEVDGDVVDDPSILAENLLYEVTTAMSGDCTVFQKYEFHDVDFAITASNISYDDDAPYQN